MSKLYKGDSLALLAELPNDSVDLILTDPPYEYVNGGDGHSELSKRAMALKQGIQPMSDGFNYEAYFEQFLRIQKTPNMLLFCSNRQISTIMAYFEAIPNVSVTLLVWGKTNPIPLGNGNYLSDTEYCVYVRGVGAYFNNDVPIEWKHRLYISGLVSNKNRLHPCQKPIELISRYVATHSQEGDVVLDCFMGSGTTGVACAKLNREFIGMELSDEYFAIASNRIQTEEQKGKLF